MLYVTYFDACAAVKLVVKEPGFENVRKHFQQHPPNYMTSLCFAEALGVLKRKMARKELTREGYFDACYMLIAYLTGPPLRLHLDDTININMDTFIQAEALAQKHELDLSDALQIITVKNGKFKNWAQESKTVLATADCALIRAAEDQGLLAWNVIDSPEPPPWQQGPLVTRRPQKLDEL